MTTTCITVTILQYMTVLFVQLTVRVQQSFWSEWSWDRRLRNCACKECDNLSEKEDTVSKLDRSNLEKCCQDFSAVMILGNYESDIINKDNVVGLLFGMVLPQNIVSCNKIISLDRWAAPQNKWTDGLSRNSKPHMINDVTLKEPIHQHTKWLWHISCLL